MKARPQGFRTSRVHAPVAASSSQVEALVGVCHCEGVEAHRIPDPSTLSTAIQIMITASTSDLRSSRTAILALPLQNACEGV